MGRVTDRVCIVTGAAQGIGRAIGEALLDEGARVCFADINGDKVAEVAESNRARLNGQGAAVTSSQVDVTDREQGRAMIEASGLPVQTAADLNAAAQLAVAAAGGPGGS